MKTKILLSLQCMAMAFFALPSIAQKNSPFRSTDINGITVHTYFNPDLVSVSSYILELEQRLVIVDAQLTYTETKAVLDHARLLKKPIDRVIITHAHPDHYLGIYAYRNLDIYALQEVADAIKAEGEGARKVFLKNFGEEKAAPEVTVPNKILPEGEFKIEGTSFVVSKFTQHESEISSVILLPEQEILVAGDLVYNKTHLFPGHNHFADWKASLKKLRRLKFQYILPGHGEISQGKRVVRENINYISRAMKLLKKDGMTLEKYKSGLASAYPDHRSQVLIDFGAYGIFPN